MNVDSDRAGLLHWILVVERLYAPTAFTAKNTRRAKKRADRIRRASASRCSLGFLILFKSLQMYTNCSVSLSGFNGRLNFM
jgi:hypothetical protein